MAPPLTVASKTVAFLSHPALPSLAWKLLNFENFDKTQTRLWD
jgi:hypothetical protein